MQFISIPPPFPDRRKYHIVSVGYLTFIIFIVAIYIYIPLESPTYRCIYHIHPQTIYLFPTYRYILSTINHIDPYSSWSYKPTQHPPSLIELHRVPPAAAARQLLFHPSQGGTAAAGDVTDAVTGDLLGAVVPDFLGKRSNISPGFPWRKSWRN